MIRVSDEKENGAGEVQVLQRLVSLAPRDKELRLRLAHKLILFGDYQNALDQLRAVIRLDPNNLPARELRLMVREQAQRQQPGI